MTDLLTHEEYRSRAAAMDLPQNAWIDGGYRPAISGKTFDTVNPATGAVLGTVAACDAADVDLAVAKAHEAFEDGRWSRLHPRRAQGGAGTAGNTAGTQYARIGGHGKPRFRQDDLRLRDGRYPRNHPRHQMA
ncbi:aldehyde dehydrogenase family protein [Frigidibacter sp. SD6-1]|uniref:aldehyde dehydrogenase family protein n=1 Tax=Frigidibacter sp. SD6-1 TaxID=3032581 RepID=UPI0032E7FB71